MSGVRFPPPAPITIKMYKSPSAHTLISNSQFYDCDDLIDELNARYKDKHYIDILCGTTKMYITLGVVRNIEKPTHSLWSDLRKFHPSTRLAGIDKLIETNANVECPVILGSPTRIALGKTGISFDFDTAGLMLTDSAYDRPDYVRTACCIKALAHLTAYCGITATAIIEYAAKLREAFEDMSFLSEPDFFRSTFGESLSDEHHEEKRQVIRNVLDFTNIVQSLTVEDKVEGVTQDRHIHV